MPQQYTAEQLARLFRHSGASTWQEALDFLAEWPDGRPDLDRDQILALQEDLERMKRQGVPFRPDATSMYGLISADQSARRSSGPG